MVNTVKEIKKKAAIAEEKINDGFDRQDQIAIELSQKGSRIKEFEEQNKAFLDEKKRLIEFTKRNEPLAEVSVGRHIEAGTRIFSGNASLNLLQSSGRCRIKEISSNPDSISALDFYEMKITDF